MCIFDASEYLFAIDGEYIIVWEVDFGKLYYHQKYEGKSIKTTNHF